MISPVRSPSTRPHTPQPSKGHDAAGTKQRASKRYTARRMLTSLEASVPSRPSTPRSRPSTPLTTSIERTKSQRRYATRRTISSVPENTSNTPRRTVSASVRQPPSNREALLTLRRRLSVESVPFNRIPSFMDHFLNYQSPSVDYDSEEIMLELAYRIKLNKLDHILGSSTPRNYVLSHPEAHRIHLLWAKQNAWASATMNDGFDGVFDLATQSRHPDSFERSTSSWTDA